MPARGSMINDDLPTSGWHALKVQSYGLSAQEINDMRLDMGILDQ